MALVTAISKIDKTVLHNAAEHKLSADWVINPSAEILSSDPALWIFEGNSVRLATQEEQDVIYFPLLKEEKLRAIDTWWKQKEETGIRVQTGEIDITLTITPDDIALINGVYTTAKETVALGIKTLSDTFQLHDIEGNMHLFTLSQLTSVLLIYSQTRAAIHATKNIKKKAISAATTKVELDLIEVP